MFRWLPVLVVFACAPLLAAPRIEAVALMKEAAVLNIGGRQQLLRAGQRSAEGVLLVSADPRQAVVEVEGRRHRLDLSRRIAGTFEAIEQTEIQIPRNDRHQYLTGAEVNGRRLLAMVDTGANIVGLSGTAAARLGIDYRKLGEPTGVSTAGGVKTGYSLLLEKVSVGGITVNHVPATVIEGDFPEHMLLGMSYLRHVGLREENGVMYLRQKY